MRFASGARRFWVLAVLTMMFALGAATTAPAQEAIPTATHAPAAGAPDGDPAATPPVPQRLGDRMNELPDILRPAGPCGGPLKTADGKTDKSPHGEVWAGVGTRGYREAGGVVCLPLSDQAAVTIAVDAGNINGYRRRP